MISDKTLVADLAALITKRDSFARDASGRLFRYHAGVYVDGEFFLRQQVKSVLVEFQKAGRWARKLADEVKEFILLDAAEVLTRPSPDILNLENGLLYIQTMEFRPHSPQFRSTLRIPICFSPGQSCPRIDRFLQEVFPAHSVELAWEILGDLVTTDRSIQKAICLVGEGGNGKGVFSQLATNFVGVENVAHLSLQRLENDRFAVARLQGKLANICPDLPGERVTDSSIFKAITGCDRITGEFKYRNSFEFTPFVRLVFSANQLPSSRDASSAYFDRWIDRPSREFLPQHRARNPALGARCEPRGSDGTQRGAEPCPGGAPAGFGAVGSSRKAKSPGVKWRRGDCRLIPVCCGLIPRRLLPRRRSCHKTRLYTAFAQACLAANRPLVTRQMFGRRVKQWRPDIRECQRLVEGRKRWVYAGITLKRQTSTEDGNSNHSIPTTLVPGKSRIGRPEELTGTIE